MPLPEDIRQEYLQALGVDNYFPRVQLPAAPESIACEWPASWIDSSVTGIDVSGSEKISTAPDITAKTGTTEQKRDSSAALASELAVAKVADAELKSAETVAPVPAQARQVDKGIGQASTPVSPTLNAEALDESTAATSAISTPSKTPEPLKEEIRLQLLCIRVNDNLAILNAMPHFGPKQLSGQHIKLLQNYLGAFAVSTQSIQIEDRPFQWPMIQNAHIDNSKSAAVLSLTAYLQQKHQDWQYKNLLIMGEQVVTRLFLPEQEEGANGDEEKESLPSLEEQSWSTFYTRSLDEILQSPTLKKEAWIALKKLMS